MVISPESVDPVSYCGDHLVDHELPTQRCAALFFARGAVLSAELYARGALLQQCFGARKCAPVFFFCARALYSDCVCPVGFGLALKPPIKMRLIKTNTVCVSSHVSPCHRQVTVLPRNLTTSHPPQEAREE